MAKILKAAESIITIISGIVAILSTSLNQFYFRVVHLTMVEFILTIVIIVLIGVIVLLFIIMNHKETQLNTKINELIRVYLSEPKDLRPETELPLNIIARLQVLEKDLKERKDQEQAYKDASNPLGGV